MEFIGLISSGKGTWGQVSGLMKQGEWEKIIILGPSYAKDFTLLGIEFDFIEFDQNKNLLALKKEFSKKLEGKIDGLEVALSIASGNGKILKLNGIKAPLYTVVCPDNIR